MISGDDIETLVQIHRERPITVPRLAETVKLGQYIIQRPSPVVAAINSECAKVLDFFLIPRTRYNTTEPVYDPCAYVNSDMYNNLHICCLDGDTLITQIVLKSLQNTDYVNGMTTTNLTPLMIAAKLRDTDYIRLLLKYGADPLIIAPNGNSALKIALKQDADSFRAMIHYVKKHRPKDLLKFLEEKLKMGDFEGTFIEWLESEGETKHVDTFKNMIIELKEIVESPSYREPITCCLKYCYNKQRLRRCHLCNKLFCPSHLETHCDKLDTY